MKQKAYKEGVKYIIRSNEDEPLVIGTFLENNYHNLPILLVDGIEMMVFSPIAEHSEELWNELSKMSRTEQYARVRELDRLVPYLNN